jgi:putative intracellular protease/amidase
MFRTTCVLTLSALIPLAMPADLRSADDVPRPRAGSSRWNVAFLVFDHMEILDFAGPAEVFESAAGNRAFNVYTVGETDRPVVSQGFVTITPQYTIANCPPPDIVVVPGGNTTDVRQREKVREWVSAAAKDPGRVFAVCTGVFVVAQAGLLDGREATTHRGLIGRLRRDYPKIKVRTDLRVVDNGNVLTSGGASAGVEGALHLVAKLCGKEAARKTADKIEYRWQPDAALNDDAAKSPGRAAGDAWFAASWQPAVEGYRQLLRERPDDGLAHYRLGVGLLATRRPEEAVRHLERAVELGLRDVNAFDYLGQARMAVKRPAEAAKAFEQAAALNKSDGMLFYNLACAYARSGQKDKALQSLEKAFDGAAGVGAMATQDDDLQNLRDDPRFKEMVRKHDGKGV